MGSAALFAQGLVGSYPAHEGAAFTMEEAIYYGKGYSRAPYYHFGPDSSVLDKRASGEEAQSAQELRFADSLKVWNAAEEGIVYGESVSRNEFGIEGGVFPSPDGKRFAFYRKDERDVTLFPLLDIGSRTGTLRLERYPMNGMASEKLSLGVWDSESGKTVYMQINDFDSERYITCVSWSPDSRDIYAQILDRSQHHLRLNRYRASDGRFVRTILSEDNPAWVEPEDPIHFVEGRNDLFIYRTDNRDGYRSLYLADTLGRIRRFTMSAADVSYLGNDGRYIYYTSAEISPVENHLFRNEIPRRWYKDRYKKPFRLTWARGWHNVELSPDCSRFLDRWSNTSTPVKVALGSCDGKSREILYEGPDPLEGYAAGKVEVGTVPSADGAFQNYYRLIYPVGFDPAKKYPVIVYVYGGPHSQLVRDSWLGSIRMWEMLMAQKGYIVYVQDNRGTTNRGAAFEKAINRACGVAEMEDQVAGLKRLLANSWADETRVGVHGWSYGGFMTISLMTNYPELFRCGVAGGPVIDWKWYEVMYGERYMDTPETNPEGFARTSLIEKAGKLSAPLLICQGAVDKTVVWEHSLSFVQECIDKGIQLDYFPYPVAEHNVFGRNRIHLMDKVTAYFEANL